MKRTIAGIAVMLVALTGCGGGGDDSKAADNIAASMKAEDSPITDEDAECFGEAVVDKVGVDKLKEVGILDDDLEVKDDIENTELEQEDAEKAADAFTSCIDLDVVLEEAFGAAGDEAIECVKDKIDDDAFKDLMTATFAGDQAGAQDALLAAAECLQPTP